MRLSRPWGFARYLAACRSSLFDREYGLPRHAIEDKRKAGFRDLRHSIHQLAILGHLDERGLSGQVVVPKIVVHGLEMPEALACRRIQCDQRISEQAGPFAI